MSERTNNSRKRQRGWLYGLAMMWLCCCAVSKPLAQSASVPAGQNSTGAKLIPLDKVVAVVNGDLVLDSDVDEDRRFRAFQPIASVAAPFTRAEAIDRLVDRTLILQQDRQAPQTPITDAEVDAQLDELKKTIPACVRYRCETPEGWQKFVGDQGFTVEELRDRWRERMEVLRFIEERFRMGIRIERSAIDAYYKQTLLPAYRAQKVAPPAEDTIYDRIQEILLQQQVSKLLDDWLKSLRAQGRVQILKPGEVLP